jgi:hypothetical protein
MDVIEVTKRKKHSRPTTYSTLNQCIDKSNECSECGSEQTGGAGVERSAQFRKHQIANDRRIFGLKT